MVLIHKGTLQNGTLHKWYSVRQRRSYTTVHSHKTLHVTKRYVTQLYSYKTGHYNTVYTESIVCYIKIHYSHNQQSSTKQWNGWVSSLTLPNPGYDWVGGVLIILTDHIQGWFSLV
jgi:hypothetical protein